MTEQQILSKLTALCARGEHCLYEMQTKMERWEVDAAMQKHVLDFLVRERYIDEERYTRFFINDKIRYNKWGRRKVEQALYMKRIPDSIYAPLLDEIDKEEYTSVLIPLLKNKRKSVKAASYYELRQKLIRFAMQRGFSYDQAEYCIDHLDDDC